MKKITLLLIVLLLTTPVLAEETFSGQSKNCHDIGYLSSDCKRAKMLPMYMTNETVAKIKYGTSDNVMQVTSKTVTNNYEMNVSGEKPSDAVIVKSYFEDDPVTRY